ncbi:hypothetical protein IT41_13660 [Paracoccus halophilus]|uniref:Uncharacterized protein n=1 Tax=Paracoccus halophilus TaxID=376733 RepID=A0A099F008_9RHOB|nr:hypothetical protein IT41_13660 [Paracoccus halophilus]
MLLGSPGRTHIWPRPILTETRFLLPVLIRLVGIDRFLIRDIRDRAVRRREQLQKSSFARVGLRAGLGNGSL